MTIDADLEEYELHLSKQCDPFYCEFCQEEEIPDEIPDQDA